MVRELGLTAEHVKLYTLILAMAETDSTYRSVFGQSFGGFCVLT